ncbi:MAG: orotidine-5'-phosphate decarboxylase [Thermodesulfobacteriota bacterium]
MAESPTTFSFADVIQKIIFALDVANLKEARRFVKLLKDKVGFFKIGLELYTAYGPEAIKTVQGEGGKIFLDLKFHDIPQTVSRAAAEAVKHGVTMLNVHAAGGLEMMQMTVERCQKRAQELNCSPPLILGVTILTSLDEGNLRQIGMIGPLKDQVARLAELAKTAGLNGVVASPQEISLIRQKCGSSFLIVTPGIRPPFSQVEKDDQKRMMTPKEAITAGANFIVLGRPIRMAPDPVAAMEKVITEIIS